MEASCFANQALLYPGGSGGGGLWKRLGLASEVPVDAVIVICYGAHIT